MRKSIIPFICFLLLLILVIPFPWNFATSVIPGWHVTIFPPYFIMSVIMILILIFVVLGYWLLYKKRDSINMKLFVAHLLLTGSAIIFIQFPFLFSNTMKGALMVEELMPFAYSAFLVGQVLFIVYFVRTIKAKRS